MTPIATWWPRKVPPTQISHFVSARRRPPALNLNLRRDKWLRFHRYFFFTNTTGGLIVMASKLDREGNKEPLIRRIAFNALLENALLE